MNTSSRLATVGRTLTAVKPACDSPAVSAATAEPSSVVSNRTCARSPNTCASATPGTRARTSRGGRRSRRSPRAIAPTACAAARPGGRSPADVPRAAGRRARTAPLRRDTASPSRSSDPRRGTPTSSFQNSRRDTGSTPVVGSSSTRIGGSCTSVHASASFCFMPPDSRSARRRGTASAASSRAGDRARAASRARRGSRRRTRCSRRSTDRRRG